MRFQSEFQERLAKFGLESQPEKTRLIEFGRFAIRNRKQHGEGKPETFTFLGFTHFCGNLTSSGAFNVWRITTKKRMVAKLKVIKSELQPRKHHRTCEVGAWLRKVVQGYYQYHAVPGNTGQSRVFRRRICRLWRSVLVRRSQRAKVGWDRLNPLLNFKNYFSSANNSLLTIVQIESEESLQNLDAIAEVEGVDILFVGPSDLSQSMGILGQLDHPKFVGAIKAVGDAARRFNKTAGILQRGPEEFRKYWDLEYRFIACGSDGGMPNDVARRIATSLETELRNCSAQ